MEVNMRYYFYAVAGLIGLMFGVGICENPDMNLLAGMAVLYSSIGLFCYSIFRLIIRKHGY
jgi:hypothetical protein